jgi:choline dehydrogenase-like flavoprotein
VACLIDEAVRPGGDLPPVHETDAVAAFGAWLRASPRRTALALRALLLAGGRGPGADLVRRVALHCYYGDARVMRALGYDADAVRRRAAAGPPPATPEERVVRGSGLSGRVRLRADVCVVGTGAGGAVAAKELAEGGLSVVMLEEGDLLRPADFTARPRDLVPAHYRDAGQVFTLGTVPIAVPLGRAVGGTTILNSATCYRTPPGLLERWGLWDARELEPFFRRVERTLGVARVPRELAGRNAHVMERGAARLGWSGEYLHRAARGCVGSGVCAFGCPSGGKQHTGNTYVPLAWAAGAVTVTGARATRVVPGRGVVARTAGGGRLRVEADLVVVACGAIGTPILLRRSGVRAAGLGRNLSLHPATGVWAELDEDVDMAAGVPQAYAVDEFAAEGIMLEGWAGPPDLLALALPARGAEHRRLMRRYRRLAQAGLMIRDDARGTVSAIAGRPLIRYDVGPDDTRRLVRAIALAAELELAAGARAVHLPIRGAPPVSSAREAHAVAGRARARDLALTAFHPLGTAAAGTVVDADLRLADGLIVADGSAVPGALGVNPQLTIMALATRAAYAVLGKAPPTDEPAPATVGRAPALAA